MTNTFISKLQLGYKFSEQREIVAFIYICYFSAAIFLFIVVMLHLSGEPLIPATYRYHALIVLVLLSILFIKRGWILPARIFILTVPPVVILVIPSLAGIHDNEFFFWFPYVPIGMSLIPHFILHPLRHRNWLIVILVIYFLFVIFIDDYLLLFSDGTEAIIPIVRENLFYYNLIPALIYVFVNVTLGLLFARIEQYEQIMLRQREDLVQAEKLASLGTLTSGIAHEINNPLNFITGSLNALQTLIEILVKQDKSDPRIREEIFRKMEQVSNDAFEGVSRAEDIIAKLGYYENPARAEREDVDLGQLLFRVLSGVESKLPYYIKLETDIPENMVIHCHPKQIALVFTHILRNAIDALESKTGGRQREKIRIDAGEEASGNGTRYRVSISNTGPAIPEQHLKRIFDPFFSTKETTKATGLGMWLSYMIIKDHGGRIEVSNTGDSVTFRVCIPG